MVEVMVSSVWAHSVKSSETAVSLLISMELLYLPLSFCLSSLTLWVLREEEWFTPDYSNIPCVSSAFHPHFVINFVLKKKSKLQFSKILMCHMLAIGTLVFFLVSSIFSQSELLQLIHKCFHVYHPYLPAVQFQHSNCSDCFKSSIITAAGYYSTSKSCFLLSE